MPTTNIFDIIKFLDQVRLGRLMNTKLWFFIERNFGVEVQDLNRYVPGPMGPGGIAAPGRVVMPDLSKEWGELATAKVHSKYLPTWVQLENTGHQGKPDRCYGCQFSGYWLNDSEPKDDGTTDHVAYTVCALVNDLVEISNPGCQPEDWLKRVLQELLIATRFKPRLLPKSEHWFDRLKARFTNHQ